MLRDLKFVIVLLAFVIGCATMATKGSNKCIEKIVEYSNKIERTPFHIRKKKISKTLETIVEPEIEVKKEEKLITICISVDESNSDGIFSKPKESCYEIIQ